MPEDEEEDDKPFDQFLVEEVCTEAALHVAEDPESEEAEETFEECQHLMADLAKGEVDPDEFQEETEERLGESTFSTIKQTYEDMAEALSSTDSS